MASLNAHNALIEHALQLNNGIADASGLVVDPSLDSYYLVGTATTAMPDILERVGKLGAAGMTVLTRGGTVTDSVRQDFTRDLGGLDKIKAELVAGVARAGKYNEAIKPRLEEFQQKFSGGVAEVVAVVDNEIVSGNLRSSAGSFLAQAAVRAHQRRIAAAERSGSRDGGRHRTIDRRHQPDCRVRTRCRPRRDNCPTRAATSSIERSGKCR